jgi:hypothetical protein
MFFFVKRTTFKMEFFKTVHACLLQYEDLYIIMTVRSHHILMELLPSLHLEYCIKNFVSVILFTS